MSANDPTIPPLQTPAHLNLRKQFAKWKPPRVYLPQGPTKGKGIPGIYFFFAAVGIAGFSFIHRMRLKREMRVAARQDLQARYVVVPLLQAEADRKYIRFKERWLRREAELMKNDPDWVLGETFYKTRWYPILGSTYKPKRKGV